MRLSRELAGIAVLAVAATVSGLISVTVAGPLTEEAIASIEDPLLRARVLSNPKAVLEYCGKAEAEVAKYDRDPYFDGAIAECFAYAHKHLKEKEAACRQRARALERLATVPADHPRRAEANELIGTIRKDQSWFGC